MSQQLSELPAAQLSPSNGSTAETTTWAKPTSYATDTERDRELHETLREIRNTLNDEMLLDVDRRFRRILNQTMDTLGLDAGVLAHTQGVSRVTVLRWMRGTAIPYPVMRKPVLKTLRSKIKMALDMWGIERPEPDATHEEIMVWHREFAAAHEPKR